VSPARSNRAQILGPHHRMTAHGRFGIPCHRAHGGPRGVQLTRAAAQAPRRAEGDAGPRSADPQRLVRHGVALVYGLAWQEEA